MKPEIHLKTVGIMKMRERVSVSQLHALGEEYWKVYELPSMKTVDGDLTVNQYRHRRSNP